MIRAILSITKPGKYISQCYRETGSSRRYSMEKSFVIESAKRCIPPLDNKSHKGQAGRIGVIGGSIEYTGAPFFAGISALKVGADLVHIFCTSSAATVIKSYSPELIVHPLLDNKSATADITPWLDRLHVIVIGPGLGRDPNTFKVVSELIAEIKMKKIPLVIDADGLFLITEKPQLIKEFLSPVVLTPNKIEYERLSKAGFDSSSNWGEMITVLKKGSSDELVSWVPEVQWVSGQGGSGRRCGGQGDLLSGSVATFLNWMLSNKDNINTKTDKTATAASLACYSACILIRKCNEEAFQQHGRSMLASDMIAYIHKSFEELFGQ